MIPENVSTRLTNTLYGHFQGWKLKVFNSVYFHFKKMSDRYFVTSCHVLLFLLCMVTMLLLVVVVKSPCFGIFLSKPNQKILPNL